VPSSLSESENKLINLDIVALKLRTKNQNINDKMDNTTHHTKKHNLSELGLDPRIVVEAREK